MRADSALSHLYDHEPCIASMKDGTQREVCWSKQAWSFFFPDTDPPEVCRFDDIQEWRPAAIDPH